MNGGYYANAWHDISTSKGWFKTILLLALLQFVPVFGQIVLYGYAYGWAREAAWNVRRPMPEHIFQGKDDHFYKRGWFVLLIAFLFNIIPTLLQNWGESLTGAFGSGYNYSPAYGIHGPGSYSVSPAGEAFGSIIVIAAFVLLVFAILLSWVGQMRSSIYGKLAPGLQLRTLWRMFRHEPGGLWRIFGMSLLIDLIVFIVAMVLVLPIILMASVAGVFAAGGMMAGSVHAGMGLGMIFVAAIPLGLLWLYAVVALSVFAELVVARALGFWTAQFDVPGWGRKDDPLPFERGPQASGQGAQFATWTEEQPAQPSGQQPTQPNLLEAPQQPVGAADDKQPIAPAGVQQPTEIQEPEAQQPAESHELEEPEATAAEVQLPSDVESLDETVGNQVEQPDDIQHFAEVIDGGQQQADTQQPAAADIQQPAVAGETSSISAAEESEGHYVLKKESIFGKNSDE